MLPIVLFHAISRVLKMLVEDTHLCSTPGKDKKRPYIEVLMILQKMTRQKFDLEISGKFWNTEYLTGYDHCVTTLRWNLIFPFLSEAHFSQTKRNQLKWFIDCISHLIKLLGAVFVYHGPILFLKAHFIEESHFYWRFLRSILLCNPIMNFETKHK